MSLLAKLQLANLFREKMQKASENKDRIRTKYRPYQEHIYSEFYKEGEKRPLYVCWCRRAGKIFGRSL